MLAGTRFAHRLPCDRTVKGFYLSTFFRYDLAFLILAIAGAAGAGCGGSTSKPAVPGPGTNRTQTSQLSRRPPLPEARPDGYVGSKVCADCHEEIASQFAAHPMGQSLNTVADAKPIEGDPPDPLDIAGPLQYRVQLQDDRMIHHQMLVDDRGDVVFDQSEEVKFALGSGQRGRTYLVEKDGSLYQSPLGWYANGAHWDLSPGYDPKGHAGFQRRIGDGCLYCHAGQMESIGPDRYQGRIFAEASVGCERCHGPGRQHVALHREPKSNPHGIAEDTIVNPADLSTAARESVCNQCHLQGEHVIPRYGREFFDFRPGDLLEDVFVVLMGSRRVDRKGRPQVVSQVEQMRASRCYEGSGGELGCVSCHDPHRRLAPQQRVAHYQDRCLNCHREAGCSLPHEQQQLPPANGSCIHCHMPPMGATDVPHTSQTDHRIAKRPQEPWSLPEPPQKWPVFDGAEQRLPDWEVSRARGIAAMIEAWKGRDANQAAMARRWLLPPGVSEDEVDRIFDALGKDQTALSELAASYLLTGQPTVARRFWERVLEIQPEDETALGGLVVLSLQLQDQTAAQRYLDRLLEIAPSDPQWHVYQAQLYWEMGERGKARAAADRVLELDPTRSDIRDWVNSLPPSTTSID